MKKVFFPLFCMLAISMSAQIVEFSDDLLSQYEDKKQEEILTRPIDLDSLFPPVDFDYAMIVTDRESNSFSNLHFYGLGWIYPNYIGYHVYIPERQNISGDREQRVLSFNSTYDTVAYDFLPKGIYEVVGMIVTNEECEEIKQLIENPATQVKDPRMSDELQRYCREGGLRGIGSIKKINANIHNGVSFATDALLVLRGNDDYLYYMRLDEFRQGAFLVEQYDYIKGYLLHNEWVLGKPRKEFTITTKDDLRFNFKDTVGVSIKNLAVKDGKFIAIMKVGPDSILYSCSVEWEKGKYYNYEYVNSRKFVSDTLDYISFKCDYSNTQSLVRKQDYVQMEEINRIFQDEVSTYRSKQEAESAARKAAIEKARKEEFARLMKEIEHQRQLEKQSLISKYGERYGLLIFEHKVTLGMTKEMCLKAWGAPRNKVIRRTDSGTQEVWTYGIAQYLIFVNGVLTESASLS